MTVTRAAIIGDGQMGLVLSDALHERGIDVRLWGPFAENVEPLARDRHSPKRLREFRLADAIHVTADDADALDGAQVIINAIPAQFIRSVWQRIRPHVPADVPIACVSKGIEQNTLLRPTQVIADVLAEGDATKAHQLEQRMCSLSGPTIAAELARRLPATMVAASPDDTVQHTIQDLFSVPWLRIYRNDDLLGVEIAGAAKNVIALSAGMVDGLEIGDNAKSALLARGLAEISRLGVALGAHIDTFFGVAGVGDLATTCFSPCGRNRTCGERLGRGETLDDILGSMVDVVEGVPTARSISQLAEQHNVDMPITKAVAAILDGRMSPRDAIDALMNREPKAEAIG